MKVQVWFMEDGINHGIGEVVNINMMAETATVKFSDGTITTENLDNLCFMD